eukprot:comp23238_c0_seq1/m.37929 comp23238_c0_seq1/g.37929  ORF comp23238_c0_seq1/g.37929 comp23238_c0_seq1/m.37929 type:complete len:480 (+) comp23238_c0_seq1:1675-3114(+)
MLGGPVHQVGCALIRAQEQQLGLLVAVDNRVLDAWALADQQQIEQGIDVLLEGCHRRSRCLAVHSKQDRALGPSLGNVLVLVLLCGCEVVVLIEEGGDVFVECLRVGRADYADATTCNISKPHVEPTELTTENKEHAEHGARVLEFGKEGRVEAEGEGDLCGGVEVCLEDGVVEGQHALKDLLLVAVIDRLADRLLDLIVAQSVCLVELHGAERPGHAGVSLRADVECSSKVAVELPQQVGVCLDHLLDVFAGERVLAQTHLEFCKQREVRLVCRLEDVGQYGVLGAQTVEEVLAEPPAGIGIGNLTHVPLLLQEGLLQGGDGDQIQQTDLLEHLGDGLVSWGLLRLGQALQVDADNGQSVGKLLDIFAHTEQVVVVVDVGQAGEEVLGRAPAVGNDHAVLPRQGGLQVRHHGACAPHGLLDQALVQLDRARCHSVKEALAGDLSNVGLHGVCGALLELDLLHKVAAQLLRAAVHNGSL